MREVSDWHLYTPILRWKWLYTVSKRRVVLPLVSAPRGVGLTVGGRRNQPVCVKSIPREHRAVISICLPMQNGLSVKRSAESTAGPTKGTMDSATLEQQPQHHYKRPYLRLANSFAESIDSSP
jgi:hypothetical protein